MPPPVRGKSRNVSRFAQEKTKAKVGGGLCIRSLVELIAFFFWLIFTGFAGYFIGMYSVDPESISAAQEVECPPPPPPKFVPRKTPCPPAEEDTAATSSTSPSNGANGMKNYGNTLDEIRKMWTCSRAKANTTYVDKQLTPVDGDLSKTKWKTILAVEPNAFFKKYLTQYPGDTAAVQPVVIFSHKAIKNFNQVSDVCKVIDVAIVPDSPGVCVSVTETFHDVASYHMLHADRQEDGTFALSSNAIDSRNLPDERAYAAARAMLSEYFKYQKKVQTALRNMPKLSSKKRTQFVGCIIDKPMELELYQNSVAQAKKAGVPTTKFWVFTSSSEVNKKVLAIGLKVIYLPELLSVGLEGGANVGYTLRRYFLQAWFAFAVADAGIRMLWQSPGTVWLGKPDFIVDSTPMVETLWAYKGRSDPRAAPFFISFDFFVHGVEERPVHLFHEILLHYDLVVAWDSVDTVASYRLAENNARYGTTSFIFPPYDVLHIDLLGRDPVKIKSAISESQPPRAVVVPFEGFPLEEVKPLLKECGLWLLAD